MFVELFKGAFTLERIRREIVPSPISERFPSDYFVSAEFAPMKLVTQQCWVTVKIAPITVQVLLH